MTRRTLASALALLAVIPSARAQTPAAAELAAAIDQRLEAAWKAAGVRAAPEVDDAEFLRRVTLDLTGTIPEEEAARGFLRQKEKDRRSRWVRGLLYGQGYAQSMAVRWSNLLLGRQRVLESGGETSPLVLWLAQQLAANSPWDDVVRRLIAAEGSLEENGAVAWLMAYENRPEEATGNALRVFCGLEVQCAQCHDHPFDPSIKQTDFWSLAAFFARAGVERDMDKAVLRERPGGEVRIPRAGGAQGPVANPRFLGGPELPREKGTHRRRELARLLTAPEQVAFAHTTIDRLWGFLFGRPLVEATGGGPPALVELREHLAGELRRSGFDLRRLTEALVLTRAYQRAAAGEPAKAAGQKGGKPDAQAALFARARLRPLPPEHLWASLERATGLEDLGAAGGGTPEERAERRRAWRAQFFATFAGDEQSGEGEQATVPQALALINGPLTNALLRAGPESPLLKRVIALPADQRLESLYLRVLSRPPSPAERKALSEGVRSSEDELVRYQDVLWALLNSSEFLYNH